MSDFTPIEVPNVPQEVISPTNGDPSKDWMAIVSIIVGILSLCGAIIPFLGCFFSLAAIVFGVLGLYSTKKTLAIIGLCAGGLAIIISLVITILSLFGPAIGSVFSEIITDLDSGY